MKIFYFRKNNIFWGIILIIIIIALFIIMRLANGGSGALESESTFMVINKLKMSVLFW